MDTYFYDVHGSKPDVRGILANMMERSRNFKVLEGMVCDGDDDAALLHRDTSKLGKFLGGCKVAGSLVTIYEKDVIACKAKLRPYNDAVAKMLFDDSAQGQALFRMVMQEVCHLDAQHIQLQDTEVYFGEGNYPEHKLNRFYNVDDEYLVNLEMQQYTNGISTMDLRIIRQHSTIFSSNKETIQHDLMSVWFFAKGKLTSDDELVHIASMGWEANGKVVRQLPFGKIHIVEMEKVKNKSEVGKTKLERFCQFMLHYNDPEKEELMKQLKEEDFIMESIRRVDTFNLNLRDMCKMIKEEFDAMSIREVQKEAETKGLMDGLKKGEKEGIKKGKKEEAKQMMFQMYEHGIPVEDIAAITKQKQKQVEQVINQTCCKKIPQPSLIN